MSDNTPEVISLPRQRTRMVDLNSQNDPGVIWVDRERVYALEKKIPYKPLLKAVQEYELKDIQRTEKAGYEFIGCSYDHPHGEILGGSFGHVMEHAVCNILDIMNNIPPGEVTGGSTVTDGINTEKPFDPRVINHHYKFAVIPAPSLDISRSRQQVVEIMSRLEQYDWTTDNINLEDIFKPTTIKT